MPLDADDVRVLLAELSSFGLVPADVIERVLASRTWKQPGAKELVDGLRDDIPWTRV